MNRTVVHTLAAVGTLFTLSGCGAHSRKSQPSADVMRGAITPVASSAPVGVLSPAGSGSQNSAITPPKAAPATSPRPASTQPVSSKRISSKPTTTKPTTTKPAATKPISNKPASTRYASERAVRSQAAPVETVPGTAAGSTAAPGTAAPAPAPNPPTSALPPGAKSTRLSSPTGYVNVDQLPEATVRVPPEYPVPARDAHVDGTVTLQALVGADGKVYDTRVIRSIPMLDGAARTAVMQWKFTPARSSGKPVPVWFDVPVTFSLH